MATNDPTTLPDQLPNDALLLVDSDYEREDSKAYQDDEIRGILDRWQIHQSFWSVIHQEAMDDDNFIVGNHWPEQLRKDRIDERRPVLTYNLFPAFCRQITNAVRKERPQLKVTPVETNHAKQGRVSNLAGTRDYSLADVYSGLIRNIEHISRADQAYDTATKNAVDHGFGYFMLGNEWSRDNPFVQDLVIHRVKDSYCVTLDPDAQEADYRDAQDAFTWEWMSRKTFDAKYPGKNPSDFAGPTAGGAMQGWWNRDGVRVTNYYKIEYRDDEVLMLSNGKAVYRSQVAAVLDDMEQESGVHVVRGADRELMAKKVKRPVCTWRRMTARDVLEGPVDLPFSAVPIFPVFGEEMIVEGMTHYESAIRHAKDAARSYNYWRTAAAEVVALQPRAPYMATAKQVAGHEDRFEQANQKNFPYLIYNHVEGVAPPTRVQPPNTAAAELQNASQDGEDMQSIIGLHDANLGRVSNEKSGKAIIARQNAGATSTFQFPDNLGRAIEQMGRLLVEAIPQIMDTQRVLRVRLPDGGEDFVEINQTVMDQATGRTYLVADINAGKFDVVLETGPSYATQRQEAADLQMELLKTLPPEVAANIVHLIVKNLGVPGSDEVSAVLRKMLPEQLKTEEEKLEDLPKGVTKGEDGQLMKDGQPWQPEPTPEMILAQKQQELEDKKIQAMMAKAEAEMATADADKAQADAKIKTAEADVARIQGEMAAAGDAAGQAQDQQRQNAELLKQVEDMIRQVLEEHEINPKAHEEATDAQLSEATIEILERVKGFVDRKMQATAAAMEASQMQREEEEEDGELVDASPTKGKASNGAASGQAMNINVNLGQRPERIRFEYDDAGNILEGVPEYSTEEEE
jgi:hypothetical protein